MLTQLLTMTTTKKFPPLFDAASIPLLLTLHHGAAVHRGGDMLARLVIVIIGLVVRVHLDVDDFSENLHLSEEIRAILSEI